MSLKYFRRPRWIRIINPKTVSNDVGKCPCNGVGGSCHFYSHCIMVMLVASFLFTAQYFANSCISQLNTSPTVALKRYLFIYVVATYTTNFFKLLHSKTHVIARSTHAQDSMLFFRHWKIFVLKHSHSRSGVQKIFNTKIYLTKILNMKSSRFAVLFPILNSQIYCVFE